MRASLLDGGQTLSWTQSPDLQVKVLPQTCSDQTWPGRGLHGSGSPPRRRQGSESSLHPGRLLSSRRTDLWPRLPNSPATWRQTLRSLPGPEIHTSSFYTTCSWCEYWVTLWRPRQQNATIKNRSSPYKVFLFFLQCAIYHMNRLQFVVLNAQRLCLSLSPVVNLQVEKRPIHTHLPLLLWQQHRYALCLRHVIHCTGRHVKHSGSSNGVLAAV